MPLDMGAVGARTQRELVSWTADDVMLYALAVGVGESADARRLSFVTENSTGVDLQVLPTYAGVLAQSGPSTSHLIGTFDHSKLVHAEQRVDLVRSLPPRGELEFDACVIGMYEQGSGALIESERTGFRPGTDEVIVRARSSVFIRGAAGFGGRKRRSSAPAPPEREPDQRHRVDTRSDQALLYRLTGDRNPLHSDPVFAARVGFARPILHGMATFAIAGRVLLERLCELDSSAFRSMSGRFSAPAYPGDPLDVEVWFDGGETFFRVSQNGSIVVDRGRFDTAAKAA